MSDFHRARRPDAGQGPSKREPLVLEAEIVNDQVTITGAQSQPFWGSSGAGLFVRLLLLAAVVATAALFAVVVAVVAVAVMGTALILGRWYRRSWRRSVRV